MTDSQREALEILNHIAGLYHTFYVEDLDLEDSEIYEQLLAQAAGLC